MRVQERQATEILFSYRPLEALLLTRPTGSPLTVRELERETKTLTTTESSNCANNPQEGTTTTMPTALLRGALFLGEVRPQALRSLLILQWVQARLVSSPALQ